MPVRLILKTNREFVPFERAELIERLRWFIQFRWAFGTLLLAVAVGLIYFPVGQVNVALLLVIAIGLLGYNWAFWFLERWLIRAYPKAHEEHAILAASSQIVLDVLTLTLVLHSAGGIETPFFIFYVFHTVIATLLLPLPYVFGLAFLDIFLLTGLAIAEMRGWIPHNALFISDDQYTDPLYVSVTLLAFSSALLLAVHFGTSIARRLRSREQEVLRLENELSDYARQLEQTNEALRGANDAKTQYFRKVSHDLKSPLAAQQSLLRVLLIELNDLPAASRHRIERAIQRGDELLALLNDLLLLSKSRDIERRVQHEWIDPISRLSGVLEAQAIYAREKNLQWHEDLDQPLPALCIEAGVLPAIAENLISNAIKYTPEGGSVTVRLFAREEHLVLEVSDTGIGIGQPDVARVGQEFFRTSQARESGIVGTGLGMTIVRSMVSAMRGRLEIESEVGKGTTVTVRLPLAHPDLLGEVEPFCRLDARPAACSAGRQPGPGPTPGTPTGGRG